MSGAGEVYHVQAGDTLSGIAKAFGMLLQVLIEANRDILPDPNRLAVDQQLLIPGESIILSGASQKTSETSSRSPINYVVQANDTLYDIAAEFEVTVVAIVELNQIVDPAFIEVGQVLRIPRAD